MFCFLYGFYLDSVNYFQWNSPGVGRNCIFLFVVGTVSMIALIAIELGYFKRSSGKEKELQAIQ